MVGLRQVTPEVPRLLHDIFGGSLYVTRSYTPNGRPLHSWHIESKAAAETARRLLPHLRVKRRQAEVLLKLRRHKNGRRAGPVSVADVALRNALRDEVRELNAVGLT